MSWLFWITNASGFHLIGQMAEQLKPVQIKIIQFTLKVYSHVHDLSPVLESHLSILSKIIVILCETSEQHYIVSAIGCYS